MVVIQDTPFETASDRITTSSFLGFSPLGVLIIRSIFSWWIRSTIFGLPWFIFFKASRNSGFSDHARRSSVAKSLKFIRERSLAIPTMAFLSLSFTLKKIRPPKGKGAFADLCFRIGPWKIFINAHDLTVDFISGPKIYPLRETSQKEAQLLSRTWSWVLFLL